MTQAPQICYKASSMNLRFHALLMFLLLSDAALSQNPSSLNALRVRGIPNPEKNKNGIRPQQEALEFAEYILLHSAPIRGSTSTRRVLDAAFHSVKNDPVTSFSSSTYYDPSHRLGLCFGRALAASLYARLHGAPLHALQKILVTGPLYTVSRGQPTTWSFHIATIMKVEDAWYTLDPIYSRPLPIEEWVHSITKNWDTSGSAKFYLLSPMIFAPLDSSQIIPFEFSRIVDGGHELKPLFVLDHNLSAQQMLSLHTKDPHKVLLTNEAYNGFFLDLLSNISKLWERILNSAPRAVP